MTAQPSSFVGPTLGGGVGDHAFEVGSPHLRKVPMALGHLEEYRWIDPGMSRVVGELDTQLLQLVDVLGARANTGEMEPLEILGLIETDPTVSVERDDHAKPPRSDAVSAGRHRVDTTVPPTRHVPAIGTG
jgi:hypothetical protein